MVDQSEYFLDLLESKNEPHLHSQLQEFKIMLLESRDATGVLLQNFLATEDVDLSKFYAYTTSVDQISIKVQMQLEHFHGLKNRIIQTLSEKWRKNTFEKELLVAREEIGIKKYESALIRLQSIRTCYTGYFQNLNYIDYLIAACQFSLGESESARKTYKCILDSSATDEIYYLSLERFFTLIVQNDWLEEYEFAIKIMQAHEDEISKNLRTRLFYIATVAAAQMKLIDDVSNYVREIPEKSRYYAPATIFYADILAEKHQIDAAINVLNTFTNSKLSRNRSAFENFWNNTALFKLGMLYYKEHGFVSALACFYTIQHQSYNIVGTAESKNAFKFSIASTVMAAQCNAALGRVTEARDSLQAILNTWNTARSHVDGVEPEKNTQFEFNEIANKKQIASEKLLQMAHFFVLRVPPVFRNILLAHSQNEMSSKLELPVSLFAEDYWLRIAELQLAVYDLRNNISCYDDSLKLVSCNLEEFGIPFPGLLKLFPGARLQIKHTLLLFC